MGELQGITVYPLTGARGFSPEGIVQVFPGGLENDRSHVLFDLDTRKRVGLKEVPNLTRLDAEPTIMGDLRVSDKSLDTNSSTIVTPNVDPIFIDEFRDQTPVRDCGDETAKYFSTLLGHKLRLGKKTNEWRFGDGVPPHKRRVAPLHIVNATSVAELQQKARHMRFDARRFRGNLLLGGIEPFAEEEWLGRTVKIGELVVAVHRRTPRCKVPGFDPETGENLADVPRLYKDLIRENDDDTGGRSFGVYAYPVMEAGVVLQRIAVGDKVTVQE